MAICIQMGKIWQALLVMEAIELMNSSISGNHLKNEMKNFQMERKIYRKDLYGRIQKGWWYGFLQRNGHRIVTQQGEKFAID